MGVTRILVRARTGRRLLSSLCADGLAFARVTPSALCAQAVPAIKPSTTRPDAIRVNAAVRFLVMLTFYVCPCLVALGSRIAAHASMSHSLGPRTVLAGRPSSPKTQYGRRPSFRSARLADDEGALARRAGTACGRRVPPPAREMPFAL